jgi:hypothetical protein
LWLKVKLVAALALTLFLAVPAAGSMEGLLDPLAGLPRGSYALEDGSIAIPMFSPAPAWLTSDVVAKVVEAGERGMGYDVASGTAVPLAQQVLFIRPGVFMYGTGLLEPVGCTMNFIYGSPGAYSIGTAGHCVGPGDDVLLVTAPTVLVSIGKCKTSHDNGIGDDWSLTPIFPQFQQYVDPNVAVIQGPQGGVYTGGASLTSPVAIKHFGHGLVVGAGGTPRAGVSTRMETKAFYFDSPSAPGDSGSPVLVAGSAGAPLGQALGILTHLVVDTRKVPSFMAGTRLTQVPATPVMGDINPLP